MARASRARYKDVTETDWQDQVYTALHLNGWKVAHFRPGMNARGKYQTAVQYDARGWPDLFCVHPASGDRFAAELKREYEQATPEQLQWLAWFECCEIDNYVWRPSDVDAMIARVTKSRKVLDRSGQ